MTAARLSRGSDKLRKFLVDQGYLGASVLITPQTYDPQSNRVPLKLSAETGPRVRVEVSGARLSKGKQRKLLPIFAEGAVDEDLLQEGRRNIRDYLQSQGYFNADVQLSSAVRTKAGRARDSLRYFARRSFPPRGSLLRRKQIFQQRSALSATASSDRLFCLQRPLQPAIAARGHRFHSRRVSFQRFSRRAGHVHGGRSLSRQKEQSVRCISRRRRRADSHRRLAN